MNFFKKAAAPIIVVILLAAYLIWILYTIVIGDATIGPVFKTIIVLVLLGLLGGGITVLYQRIQELKKEDEDDVTRKY